MELNARIFDLLTKQKKTASELSKYLGISNASVSAWKNEGSYPSSKYIKGISEFLNVSVAFLVAGEEHTNQSPDPHIQELIQLFDSLDREGRVIVRAASYYARDRFESRKNKDVIKSLSFENAPNDIRPVIVYDMPSSAGTSQFLDSEDYTVIDFPAADIPLNTTFGVRIRGDSMSPEILDGDIVLVKQQPAVNDNEIGIFLLNGEGYCKRYLREKGRSFLVSINPQYDPISINEYNEPRTIGRVIGTVRE